MGRRPPPGGVVVIGDLLLDVSFVHDPSSGRREDVFGEIQLRQGGSAASTARWLARLGVPTSLIACVGRDLLGDALIRYISRCGVNVHAVRLPGAATGRLAVLLDHDGERSFVIDRRAATKLPVAAVKKSWLAGARALHCPAYSFFGEPLRSATLRAIEIGRGAGALLSVDLASETYISREGPAFVRTELAALRPDLIVGTAAEANALLGHAQWESLTSVAPRVVIKRGSRGAVLVRRSDVAKSIEVPAAALDVTDTTGAGDAFVAGFLAEWAHDGRGLEAPDPALVRAVCAGHDAAAQELAGARVELPLEVPPGPP